MPKPVKVYNKGIRPVVSKRGRKGVEAIHPGKFLVFNAKTAMAIIDKFENACSEEDYREHLKKAVSEVADIADSNKKGKSKK